MDKFVVAVIVAILSGLFLLSFNRYSVLLGYGDAGVGTREREAYANLRSRLADGGTPAKIYIGLLQRFLDATDRFFGDFNRDKPPLWTPASFDRCLLLALLYPILTIFAFWILTTLQFS